VRLDNLRKQEPGFKSRPGQSKLEMSSVRLTEHDSDKTSVSLGWH
jgi:hypothetical protein